MSERNYYVICDDNCRFESMTKEQIIAAIAEATGNTPTAVDDAFITKIKESNHNANLTFWKGTEAEFNALSVTAAAYRVIVDANGKLYFLPSANNMSELSYEQGDDNAIQLKHGDNDVFPNIMRGQTEPVADCVVEQGTNYSKWDSGKMEQWGTASLSPSGTTKTITINLAQSFYGNDYNVQITPTTNGSIVERFWCGQTNGDVGKYSSSIIVSAVTSTADYAVSFDWRIIGKWK